MTRTSKPVLWIDATQGVAGDMLLAALLDAGASFDDLQHCVETLARVTGERVAVDVEQVRRHGLRASRLIVTAPPSTVRRGLAEVLAVVADAGLPAPAQQFAEDVFRRLAEAEARVHGVAIESIHFHEVGALDSIVDVVGCASALDGLGLLAAGARRVVSVVAVGGGTARTAHGTMPVPVPAVVELLTGALMHAGAGDRELCTPTGAALVMTLATEWGPLPPLAVTANGSGAGTYDPLDRPNITRVVIGAPVVEQLGWHERDLVMLEATVDDLDPRLWPQVLDAAHDAGALDAWVSPVLMRHGRPGHVLSALVSGDTVDATFTALALLGVTLGARAYDVRRLALPRDSVTVVIADQPVAVKRGLLDGRAVTLQPEYRDAVAAAQASGLSLPDVLDQARTLARALVSSDRLGSGRVE